MKKKWQQIMTQVPPSMRQLMRHAWTMFAVILVVLAIVFTLFRALTPWVKEYKGQVETQLSQMVGQKVTIKDIETSWYWFVPVLRMDQVTFADSQGHILALHQVMVGINLFNSLWHWQVKPGMFYLDNAHFTIRQTDHGVTVDGIEPTAQGSEMSSQSALAMVGVLLSQNKIIIRHVSADIALRDGIKVPLQEFNVKISQRSGRYRIHGQASLAQDPKTDVSIIADLKVDSSRLALVSGQLYMTIRHVKLVQWQGLLPHSIYQLTDGVGQVESWIDMKLGHITHVQSRVQLSDVAWVEPTRTKARTISSLTGNMFWKKTTKGWRLSADKVSLDMKGMLWDDNALILDYSEDTHSTSMYIKTLNLDQVLHCDVTWPAVMQPVLALKPKGELQDTQLGIQDDTLTYFLTKFSGVTWQATKDIPALSNLSGAFYWQPTEGRLELDGEHTTLTSLSHLPSLTFDTFNVALDWKELSQGLRVSLDRLVLSHPNLVLSATGAIDNPLGADANVRLAIDFSAKAAQYWLPFIPTQGLKPKFAHWLQHDILRINQVAGRLLLSGPWAEFPFDNQTGTFSIDGHASGVDIRVTPQWPLNQDIDADLHLVKRRFSADIDQALLSGVMIKNTNLVVADIGFGRESLLLHGKIEAAGEDIKTYVFSSPLKHRLSRWRGVTIHDVLGLDLQLEVPLYPESDHVLALGSLQFKDNQVSIEAVDNPAIFEAVTGRLQFNEYGLTDGGLEGSLADYPFTVNVHPLSGPKAGTELGFDGEVTIDYLQRIAHHPMLSFMQGQLIVSGLWTLYPEVADLDKLHINSSLAGVAIHLPKPVGKTMLDIAPISVDLAFHPNHIIDIVVDYDKRVTADFSVQETKSHHLSATGDIHLGPGSIVKASKSGLRISGSVEQADVDVWRKVFATWPKESSTDSVFDSLKTMDISVSKVLFLGQTYQNLQFKAHQLTPKAWSAHLDQADISGDITYDSAKNDLSGHLAHLYVQVAKDESAKKKKVNLVAHPDALPNLNLVVDEFKYNGVIVGKLELNSKTSPGQCSLTHGSVSTPEYYLSMEGEWTEKDKKSESSLKAQARMNNLGKSLERWNITPAMDAHKGEVMFNGHWPGAFYDFSLRRLAGQMHITLKDGRISNLDKKTEEKLGLGKLLSILSLQTIPRRLKLDFSDLSQKGYSFDVFKGNFDITNGVMTTQDSTIDGPVAFARMEGDLDLVNHLYDLTLKISPYIGASLPIVATIAGGPVTGPVAGVATWVALKIINQGMQKINAYTYKVSGPWSNPVVQQVSIVRAPH